MNIKLKQKLEKLLDTIIKNTDSKYYQPIGLKQALLDDACYLHVNVSNRRDGKSFTTTHVFSEMMLKLDFKVLFLARDERSRLSYFNQIKKVFDSPVSKYKSDLLEYRNIQRWYMNIYYQSEHIASIIDYSEIESLKNESAYFSQFDVIFIDEFIVSPYRYLRDEYSLLKTLMKSINRENPVRKFDIPKVFLAGNAINFDSPLLSGFDLLNKIETQKINTFEKYERGSMNLIIEKHKNENANVTEENDMFPDESEDANTLGDFVFNNYNIEKNTSQMNQLVIDLDEFYLYVYYNHNSSKIMLEIKGTCAGADFCISKASEDENVQYLGKNDYWLPYKFDKLPVKYINSYSKTFISKENFIKSIKFYKIIAIHRNKKENKKISDEKYNNDIIISRSKYFLSKEFNLELF